MEEKELKIIKNGVLGGNQPDKFLKKLSLQKVDSVKKLLAANILSRLDTLASVFGKPSSLTSLIESLGENKKAEIKKKIESSVSLHNRLLKIYGESSDEEVPEGTEEKYRFMINTGLKQPMSSLADTGAPAPICNLQAAAEGLAEDEESRSALYEEMRRGLERLDAKWQWITRTQSGLREKRVPMLYDLWAVKAPLPLSPTWNEASATAEQRYLGDTGQLSIQNTSAEEGDDSNGSNHGAVLNQPKNLRRISNVGRTNASVSSAGPSSEGCECDPNKIIQNAGGQPLGPPAEGDEAYTFPGHLATREDIFYDYSVILPVEDCAFTGLAEDIRQRSILPIKFRIEEIRSVIKQLEQIDFGAISGFGDALLEQIEEVLERAGNINRNTSEDKMLEYQRELRELAAAVRTFSRHKLLRLSQGENPLVSQRAELQAAIFDIKGTYGLVKKSIPKNGQNPELRRNTLWVHDSYGVKKEIMDAKKPAAFEGDWDWDDHDQHDEGAMYLSALANAHYNRVKELEAKAQELVDSVHDLQGVSSVMGDFEQFFAARISEAAYIIEQILDELADIYPVSAIEPHEGNKRLGLQLVYRQWWLPQGYVRGRLVGHKNLPPDTEETVRRRTFVRSSTETQSLEAFTASSKDEFSRSQKESSEVVNEMATNFNFSTSVGGGFNFEMGSLNFNASSGLDLRSLSRSTHSRIGELTFKSTKFYNDKREIKVREQYDFEDEQETTFSIKNLNKEITANYFYYQLLREYMVTVELEDIRPVLLRSKDIPTKAMIDDRFVARHAHILVHALPDQLSLDMQETVNAIDSMGRGMIAARENMDSAQASFEAFRSTTRPTNTEEHPTVAEEWDTKLQSLEEVWNETRETHRTAEEVYLLNRTRLDRVVSHVRKNRCRYMQYIWQASPTVDDDKKLMREKFSGIPLPEVTRGLMREGYLGAEEIFSYSGPSISLAQLITDHMIPGADVVNSMDRADLEKTTLFQSLKRYYPKASVDELVNQIENMAFVHDPANDSDDFKAERSRSEFLSSRLVQVAQDAVVVETMPGSVPLLEGYQMAQRYLAVQRSCLQNRHLKGRIESATWETGDDSYRVYHRDGQSLPVEEVEP